MTREEMNLLPLGFLGWLLCVTGAVIASLPQWFVVQVGRGATAASAAIEAEIIGLPILFVGSLLLIDRKKHTSELQSLRHLVCRLVLEKKKVDTKPVTTLSQKERPRSTD